MATANVWTMSEPLGNGLAVINDFVDDYHRNKKGYYKRLAKRVQVICRNNTRDIQALITYRAKKKKSLRKKLENMNEKRLREGLPPFQTRQEIEEQLVDLAGVRIALYFPQEKQRVQEEIGNWFPSVVWKKKPGYSKKTGEEGQYRSGQGPLEDSDSCNADASTGTNENGSYNRVFAGYVADHFHVKISKIQSERPKKLEEWMEHHVVEIQVVSVLLHAWAEVEHDIEYKQIRAKAGNEEKVILDALNGSIM
ncbi:hypothetical protein BU26DRAFT_512837 [Trematosphaeria pertusa]|uniref:RelA/SpoT domain-containing protein n=1 Tax=Trematosphaeria pertusa TaxID=390896 RepID=A0A6A6J0P9_9PLEO|nr:uncharacterized protein BU26DRAFT_512837 [Trematosphaeria pertusa]KAF2255887.1 hypothetical protein BU26DRAFT_512837 [Trematosphaeria pertusa]